MREVQYKAVGDRTLLLHVASPPRPAGTRAALAPAAAVFYHGGGWVKGDWTQFRPQAARLAALGLVAVLVEYRLDGPVLATEDAIDAMNAVADHADDLGFDASRIVAIGGSAGGHLALATSVLNLSNTDPGRRPAALALLNPVTDTTGDYPKGFGRRHFDSDEQAERYSPLHHVTGDIPPTLVLHGTADTAVCHENSTAFVEAVQRHGGQAELVSYAGQPHGFFNPRGTTGHRPDADGDRYFELTIAEIAGFVRRTLLDAPR